MPNAPVTSVAAPLAASPPCTTENSSATAPGATGPLQPIKEIGGPPGPEPTRYGDWEKSGRCIDF